MNQQTLPFPDSRVSPACDYCGERLVPSGCTTGGGTNAAGETLCFACCGFLDAITMARTEPGEVAGLALYVADGSSGCPEAAKVANWPGTLSMNVTAVTRWVRGGFGSKRRTLYFRGPMGSWWSGVEYNGNAGNLLRNVRRLKS